MCVWDWDWDWKEDNDNFEFFGGGGDCDWDWDWDSSLILVFSGRKLAKSAEKKLADVGALMVVMVVIRLLLCEGEIREISEL